MANAERALTHQGLSSRRTPKATAIAWKFASMFFPGCLEVSINRTNHDRYSRIAVGRHSRARRELAEAKGGAFPVGHDHLPPPVPPLNPTRSATRVAAGPISAPR
jgi:hypothetical protein